MLKFIVAAALAVSPLVFGHTAIAKPLAGGEETGGGGAANQTLSWDQFRDACVNPAKYNNQRPPQNIRVTCEHLRTVWEDSAKVAGNPLDNTQGLTASLMSDKYHIAKQQFEVDVPQTRTACAVLKQVEERYSEQLDLTCADLQKSKGTLGDFCMQAIQVDINDKAKVQRRDTGKIFNTCQGGEQPAIGARGGQKGS